VTKRSFDSRTMSDAVLPPEILDYIFDLLHNERETLKQCCLVSRLWTPRIRKYLFAHIGYSSHTLKLWINTFPDPTNSPAPHVRILTIDCYPGDLEGASDWIRTFSCVVELSLNGHPTLPFALFHGLSHNLRSLKVHYIKFSCPDLFDFICSCPLLENLILTGEEMSEDNGNDFHGLQTSPPLTGCLMLIVRGGMGSAPRHLLNLPNGLRFRELVFLLILEKDLLWIRELVLKCSDTLECLDVKYKWFGTFSVLFWRCRYSPLFTGTLDPIDLSKATKLKDLIFRLKAMGPGRIIAMLETITPEHRDLRQVSIHLPFKRIPPIGDVQSYLEDHIYEMWLQLDRLLVQFWELRSIRPKVVVIDSSRGSTQELKDQIGCLFPEITARGIIDLVED